MLEAPGDNSPILLVDLGAAHHCEGFAGSGLPVGKDSAIVPFNNILDQFFASPLENLLLQWLLCKYLVEAKYFAGPLVRIWLWIAYWYLLLG